MPSADETQEHEDTPRYRDHVRREGRQSWNDNPDGCYWCGSMHHHSNDCRERDQ